MNEIAIRPILIATALAFGCATAAQAEPSKELHIMWAGGESGQAWDACLNKPFTERYGIKVVAESPTSFPKLKAMEESGQINSTIFDLGTEELQNAVSGGLLEKLDYDKIKPFAMYDEAKNDYGIGTSYFSTIMAWRDGVKAPSN